jgi:hypothetical protein
MKYKLYPLAPTPNALVVVPADRPWMCDYCGKAQPGPWLQLPLATTSAVYACTACAPTALHDLAVVLAAQYQAYIQAKNPIHPKALLRLTITYVARLRIGWELYTVLNTYPVLC